MFEKRKIRKKAEKIGIIDMEETGQKCPSCGTTLRTGRSYLGIVCEWCPGEEKK